MLRFKGLKTNKQSGYLNDLVKSSNQSPLLKQTKTVGTANNRNKQINRIFK